MIGTDAQKRSFRDRLTRIEQGGANTTRHVYVGPVQDPVGGQARKARRAPSVGRAGPRRRLAGELFMVPFAMFCGMLSVVATRVAFFHHLGGLEQLGGEFHGVALTTIAAAAMALLLFVVLRILFNLRGGARGRAALAGLLLAALFEDIAAVRLPGLFALIYSPQHVGQVAAMLD
jgi:hypothetical protein